MNLCERMQDYSKVKLYVRFSSDLRILFVTTFYTLNYPR